MNDQGGQAKKTGYTITMVCGFTCWFKSLFLMAALFGALGGMTSWGYFFFENRAMCPCASAGMENAEAIVVAQPYSDELMLNRSLSFGGSPPSSGWR